MHVHLLKESEFSTIKPEVLMAAGTIEGKKMVGRWSLEDGFKFVVSRRGEVEKVFETLSQAIEEYNKVL